RGAEALLTLAQAYFSELLLSDIEVDPEDPVTPDVCMAAEPAHSAVRHTQPKLVVECFPMLNQAFLLDITCTPVFQRDTFAQLIGRNDACALRKPEQMGLLSIDDGLARGDIRFKRPDLRRVQCEPQSALTFSEAALALPKCLFLPLKPCDVDHRTNSPYRFQCACHDPVESAPMN